MYGCILCVLVIVAKKARENTITKLPELKKCKMVLTEYLFKVRKLNRRRVLKEHILKFIKVLLIAMYNPQPRLQYLVL